MVYDTLKEKGENILPYLTKAVKVAILYFSFSFFT